MTTSTQIGLKWSDGLNNGGSPVVDYKISYATGADQYAVYESGIITNSLIVVGLTPGVSYKFKVQSRSSFGYSDYSAEVTILTA
jgi:hypothetical protein